MTLTTRPSAPLCEGVTLVELIVTLSVAIILVSVAVPGFKTLTAKNRINSAVNGLVSGLHLARSEAVNRAKRVTLCPSSDGTSCLDNIEWQGGYVIFVDEDEDREFDADEQPIRYVQKLHSTLLIRSASSQNGRRKISYFPTGISGGQMSTFTFCDRQNNADPLAVIISNTGRPRLSTTRSGGEAIDCSSN
ncbi:MAG: GspH/FimT family pseudopilin [Candidatus Sedimenticola sp. 6PFRAG1]